MKTQIKLPLALPLLLAFSMSLSTLHAQGTAFTYQGWLSSNAVPVTGVQDFEFRLFDNATAGAQIGSVLTVGDVGVTNGQFTVVLDFGAVFDGSARWLQIALRPGTSSGAFTNLVPRQQITAVPYAIRAGSVSGSITAAQLPPEALTANITNRELESVVRAMNPANAFAGDGSGLQNVNATAVGPGDQIQYQSMFYRKLPTVPMGISSYGAAGVVVGDFNKDGRPDILAGHGGIGASTLFTNNGSGNVQMAISSLNGLYMFQRSGVVGDFNGDGSLDVAAGDMRENAITIFTNHSNGNMSQMTRVLATNITAVAAADINGDGKADLLAATLDNTAKLRVFLGSGGSMVASGVLDLPGHATDLATGDIDGNGRADVVASCPYAGKLAILTNPSGALVAGPQVTAVRPFVAALGKFDYGNSMDIAYISGRDDTAWNPEFNVYFLMQRTTLGFQPAGTPYTLFQPTYYSSGYGARLVVGDFNRDGIMDVLAGYGFFYMERTAVLLSSWDGVPTLAVDWTNPGIVDFGVADFNGDGNLDIGTTAGRGAAVWLRAGEGIQASATSQFMGEVSVHGGMLADAGLMVNNGLIASGGINSSGPLVVNGGITATGNVSVAGNLTASGSLIGQGGIASGAHLTAAGNISANGIISGNGSGLTLIPAGQLTGTIPDSRLSGNIALRAGGNTFSGGQTVNGNQTINGSVGIGTAQHGGSLHVYSANNPTVVRVQSTGTPGFGRLEFVSNPQGDLNEWRPAYIQSTDAGGFTGGLSFMVNGTGANNKFGEVEAMRIQNGRVGIGNSNPGALLQVGFATCNGSVWVNSSDRNLKGNFAAVDPQEVLEKVAALPIQSWSYTNDVSTRHVGPMAQDFQAAFGLGADNRQIATVDADGVALAAIQGLHRQLKEARRENEELKRRLETLEQIVRKLGAD